MKLTKELNDLLYQIQNPINYIYEPDGAYQAANLVIKAIKENKHITVDADKDPDGYFGGRIFCDILDSLGYKNYSVVKTIDKRHGIDGATKIDIASNNSGLLVVIDSSSDKLEELRAMSELLDVIVIDHHLPTKAIPPNTDNFVFINSHLLKDSGYKSMSAGLLVFLTFLPLTGNHVLLKKELASLAYASVITDSIPIDSHKLISFMETTRRSGIMHPLLYEFTSQYHTSLSREFISFQVSPRLNSCFRSSNLDYVYDLFFRKRYRSYINHKSIRPIEEVYSHTKELIRQILSICKPEQVSDFILVDLGKPSRSLSLGFMKMRQYTGLIANEFSKRSFKPCIAYIGDSKKVKGSVRDYFGRPLLNIFSNFISAGGHPPAFGFEDNAENFNYMIRKLDMISKNVPKSTKTDLQLTVGSDAFKDMLSFKQSVEIYSSINEMGTSVPNVYLDVTIPPQCKISNWEEISTTNIDSIQVKSFSGYLFPNVNYIFKPINNALVR